MYCVLFLFAWFCIQPYAHVGIYSEGEFALSPTIVQLAAERKLPMGGDWDTTMLGHDEGKCLYIVFYCLCTTLVCLSFTNKLLARMEHRFVG